MNNKQLSDLIYSSPITKDYFNGVFAADTLPYGNKRKHGFYIANQDPISSKGSHWVSFFIPSNRYQNMEYFDSYGMYPPKLLESFLNTSYIRSTKFIQNAFSATCGQYCMYYIYQRCKGKSLEEIVSYFTDEHLENDIYVNNFIEEKFSVDLNIFDDSFLFEQICKSYS